MIISIKSFIIIITALILFAGHNASLSQENNEEKKNTPSQEILDIISEVNKRSSQIDKIREEGEITLKTAKIDNSADIVVNLQRDDKIWFNIEGTLGKKVAEAFYGKSNYIFFNNLDDIVYLGPTKMESIWSTIKIKCTFDDLMNILSGATVINYAESDTLSLSQEGGSYVLSVKSKDPILGFPKVTKYWIQKSFYNVEKYAVIEEKMGRQMKIDFSSFTSLGDARHASKVEIRRTVRGSSGEFFSFVFSKRSLNQSGLSFSVSYPSDIRRVTTK